MKLHEVVWPCKEFSLPLIAYPLIFLSLNHYLISIHISISLNLNLFTSLNVQVKGVERCRRQSGVQTSTLQAAQPPSSPPPHPMPISFYQEDQERHLMVALPGEDRLSQIEEGIL